MFAANPMDGRPPPFNSDLSKWDVSKVTDMSGMFASATSFNNDLSKWEVSNGTMTNGIFYGDSCSLCDRVSHRLEAPCRNSCRKTSSPAAVDYAHALPLVIV